MSDNHRQCPIPMRINRLVMAEYYIRSMIAANDLVLW
jgi:hypothetical protein